MVIEVRTSPEQPTRITRAPRSLASYLILPRPHDLGKALVLPAAAAVGSLSGSVHLDDLPRLVVAWVVLEFLVYQARYQWNDARGFWADQRHPNAAERGRLPGPVERGRAHIAASRGVTAARLLLAVVVIFAFPGLGLAPVLVVASVAVFVVAAAYESLRSSATGHSQQTPPPLRPSLVSLWVAVGAGYAVRGMTGLALVINVVGHPGLAVVAAIAMWALGIVFVTTRWCLESLPFAVVNDGAVTWESPAGQAREHTLGLTRWLPQQVTEQHLRGSAGLQLWRCLHGRSRLTAPWNVACVVAGGSSLLLGLLLVTYADGGVEFLPGALVAVIGAGLAAVVVTVRRARLLTVLISAAVLTAALAALHAPSPEFIVLPWLVALAAYTLFTFGCLEDLAHPIRTLTSTRRGRA
jgi:hypothetical protein